MLEILTELTNKINSEDRQLSNMINACRDDIYGSARRALTRRLFDPHKRLGVVFMDLNSNSDGAVDDGGPTREFCRLLLKDIQNRNLFEGPDHSKLLSLDSHGKHFVIFTFIQGSSPYWKYVKGVVNQLIFLGLFVFIRVHCNMCSCFVSKTKKSHYFSHILPLLNEQHCPLCTSLQQHKINNRSY